MSLNKVSLLVVDCQNDFVDGALACSGALEAVKAIVELINAYPSLPVLYSADWHSPTNRSFIKYGGQWPEHCVAGEHGAQIHEAFLREVQNESQRPGRQTIYRKGLDDHVEEYSAIAAKNEAGNTVEQDCLEEVWVCGIASEFCVRESALDLLRKGRTVTVLTDALGYVELEPHRENLKYLEDKGVLLRESTDYKN